MVVFIFKAKIVTGGDARFPVTTLTFCTDGKNNELNGFDGKFFKSYRFATNK